MDKNKCTRRTRELDIDYSVDLLMNLTFTTHNDTTLVQEMNYLDNENLKVLISRPVDTQNVQNVL